MNGIDQILARTHIVRPFQVETCRGPDLTGAFRTEPDQTGLDWTGPDEPEAAVECKDHAIFGLHSVKERTGAVVFGPAPFVEHPDRVILGPDHFKERSGLVHA